MKIHTDNTGAEIDAPSPVMPCQSLQERLGVGRSGPVAAGPLPPEFKEILERDESIDFGAFHFAIQSQQGVAAAYKAAAARSEKSALSKSEGVQLLQKAERLMVPLQNKEMLERFRNKTAGVALDEQLSVLVEKACNLLSHESAALLRKAVQCFDFQLVHFFFEEAFVGQHPA